jgi:hypothetical protein
VKNIKSTALITALISVVISACLLLVSWLLGVMNIVRVSLWIPCGVLSAGLAAIIISFVLSDKNDQHVNTKHKGFIYLLVAIISVLVLMIIFIVFVVGLQGHIGKIIVSISSGALFIAVMSDWQNE